MRSLVGATDPVLHRSCQPVDTIDSYVRDLAAELLAFILDLQQNGMRAYGLAAPQLGEPVQVFAVASPAVKLVALNPVVTKTYGTHTWVEGCLSLPGQFYSVTRPKLIKFQYLALDGQLRAGKFHDDYAGIFQHEIQHLSGILISAIGKPISAEALCQ